MTETTSSGLLPSGCPDIDGGHVVDASGNAVHIGSINWFGIAGATRSTHRTASSPVRVAAPSLPAGTRRSRTGNQMNGQQTVACDGHPIKANAAPPAPAVRYGEFWFS